jgi:hypothetical protein
MTAPLRETRTTCLRALLTAVIVLSLMAPSPILTQTPAKPAAEKPATDKPSA